MEKIDLLIRKGQSKQAQALLRERLKARHSQRIPRAEAARWASLCRRSGWAEGGLLALNPYVRPPVHSRVEATDPEKIEYAHGLVSLGVQQEARALLREVRSDEASALLTHAFSLFTEWNYEDALPLLRDYVKHAELAPYARLIGRVNLLAAISFLQRTQESSELFREILEECERGGHELLAGNIYEIQAQTEVQAGQLGRAENYLNESLRRLQNHENFDRLFLNKWLAILRLKKEGLTNAVRHDFTGVIAEAQSKRQWETWRDCDYWLATSEEEKAKVFYGTPYFSYRRRIEKELRYHADDRGFVWRVGPGHAKASAVLDVQKGLLAPTPRSLKTGQVVQRLLETLALDFYKPPTVAQLHATLFPDRYYNPESSPDLIHQAMKRLRQWIAQNKVPLSVVEDQGLYRLRSQGRVDIHLRAQAIAPSAPRARLADDLAQEFRSQPFSRKEFEAWTKLSSRAANLRIAELLTANALEKIGAGPQTKYKVKASPR